MTEKPAPDVVEEIKGQLGPKFKHLAEAVATEHQAALQARPDAALAKELAECEIAPFPHATSEYYVVLVDEDLRNRILSALRTHDDTLEEAAKVCEQRAQEFLSPQYAMGQPLSSFQERFACAQCAEAIRNLKGKDRT